MADETTNTAEEKEKIQIKKFNFHELGLFATSDSFESHIKAILRQGQNPKVDNIEMYLNTVQEQIKTTFNECGILQSDFDALTGEIGMLITEENAVKARAVVGRWLVHVDFNDLYCAIMGLLKLRCVLNKSTFESYVTKTLGFGTEECPYDISGACTLVLCWAMIIESGVAASKSEQDKQPHMPATIAQCIFFEKLSLNAELFTTKPIAPLNDITGYMETARIILGVAFDFFIANANRYMGKQPHPSECIYLSVIKRSFRRVHGEPMDYIYRALDNCDWNLYTFIADENN